MYHVCTKGNGLTEGHIRPLVKAITADDIRSKLMKATPDSSGSLRILFITYNGRAVPKKHSRDSWKLFHGKKSFPPVSEKKFQLLLRYVCMYIRDTKVAGVCMHVFTSSAPKTYSTKNMTKNFQWKLDLLWRSMLWTVFLAIYAFGKKNWRFSWKPMLWNFFCLNISNLI
jgi:hypothetical protein